MISSITCCLITYGRCVLSFKGTCDIFVYFNWLKFFSLTAKTRGVPEGVSGDFTGMLFALGIFRGLFVLNASTRCLDECTTECLLSFNMPNASCPYGRSSFQLLKASLWAFYVYRYIPRRLLNAT